MAAKKPNRQQMRKKQASRAARAAELARRQRVRKQRVTIGGILAVVAVVGVIAVLLTRGGGSGTDLATTPSSTNPSPRSSTTAPAPATSAAGKPCVPVAEKLPAGAPAVPVKVGPPPTTLVMEDLKTGTGETVTPGANVTVNYIGVSCSTGMIFDASYGTGKPLTSPLAQLIPGWQQGIPGMKVGGQRLLGIPPAQGYGPRGSGSKIAPDETLWFVIDMLASNAA